MEQGPVLSAGAAGARELTGAFVRRRFAEAGPPGLKPAPPGPAALPEAGPEAAAGRRGDHDLNPGLLPRRPLIPAGVLVPILERPGGLTVLLTRRAPHLRDHAGQISFPGGRVAPGDEGPLAAALREAEEEIGLGRDRVAPVGLLDLYVTRTGFAVTPLVGLVDPPERFVPDPLEVAELFELPLAFVLDPANHRRQSRDYEGVRRSFYVLPWRDYYIWGATAGMLVNLAQVLRAP